MIYNTHCYVFNCNAITQHFQDQNCWPLPGLYNTQCRKICMSGIGNDCCLRLLSTTSTLEKISHCAFWRCTARCYKLFSGRYW